MNKIKITGALFTFLFSLLLSASTANAQSGMGLYTSEYLPTSSQFLNPAATADAKVWLQYNFAGVQVYADNNVVSLLNYKYAASSFTTLPAIRIKSLISTRYVTADAAIDGPVITLSQEKWGVSLFTRARACMAGWLMPMYGMLRKPW